MANTAMTFGSPAEIKKHTGWFIALGVVFIIAGVLAIAAPFVAGVFVTITVAWVLIVTGAAQIWQAWSMRSWGGFAWQLVIGLVFVIGGIAMLINPIAAAVGLTLLVGAMFIAKGVMQVLLAFRLRPHHAWGWMLAAGALAVLVGLMILSSWPFSTTWTLGTLAGISLVFSGWSYVMIAMAARRMAPTM